MSEQAAQACINQHSRNIHTLYAETDGSVYWAEAVSRNAWDVLAGTADPVAIIYQAGNGSQGCNAMRAWLATILRSGREMAPPTWCTS